YGVRAVDDRLTRLTSQPPLEKPVLATGVAPENGWWVTGLDLITGGLAVSVSHDQGRSWTTRRLGTAPGADDAPAVATVHAPPAGGWWRWPADTPWSALHRRSRGTRGRGRWCRYRPTCHPADDPPGEVERRGDPHERRRRVQPRRAERPRQVLPDGEPVEHLGH